MITYYNQLRRGGMGVLEAMYRPMLMTAAPAPDGASAP